MTPQEKAEAVAEKCLLIITDKTDPHYDRALIIFTKEILSFTKNLKEEIFRLNKDKEIAFNVGLEQSEEIVKYEKALEEKDRLLSDANQKIKLYQAINSKPMSEVESEIIINGQREEISKLQASLSSAQAEVERLKGAIDYASQYAVSVHNQDQEEISRLKELQGKLVRVLEDGIIRADNFLEGFREPKTAWSIQIFTMIDALRTDMKEALSLAKGEVS